jgi:hypothetical protein
MYTIYAREEQNRGTVSGSIEVILEPVLDVPSDLGSAKALSWVDR